ncbi:putative peptidoglycan lipid II flippase [Bacillus oleivorans]|uniref:Putative peptidoglycan lipid II flippase n=1 Tax=Bacillus oleivorans TaxID=1448271 RepID=A0A285CIB3_9BACI|nr:oligosaccharide flippase family protein [Bacillus oleivorans]SNX67341.1 putative peptidoglycan lipid II flippase [Bacillus oleivorans]
MANLKKAAIWITLLAIVLKLSGFLREGIVAHQFGASDYTDGYKLAFSFITLVVAMISVGFNNVFLPLYMKEKKEKPVETERNANALMNITVVIFLVLSIPLGIWADDIVPFIYANMTPGAEEVAVNMTRLFFYGMAAIALSGILESYLQSRRTFVPTHISKLLATLMSAVFAILFSEQWGIYSLAYGFLFGTVCGVIIQFIYLRKREFYWKPQMKLDKTFQKTFIVLIIPALLNSVVGQVNMFVNNIFASGTITGAVTYLNNASLVVSIPSAIYGTTIATIIFTLLSERADDQKGFQQTFYDGMRLTWLTLLPITGGLLVVGYPLLEFIYQRGAYTAADTQGAYIALLLYLPMILTQGLQFIVSKSMYAKGKTAVVFRISVTTIVLNLILNFLLVDRFGYPALALSSSLVSVYFLTVSTVVVYREFDKGEGRKLAALLIRGTLPTLVMVLPLYLLQQTGLLAPLYSLIELMIYVPLGVVLYVAGLYFLYREGFNSLMQMVRRRKKSNV